MTLLIADFEGDGLLPDLTTIWQLSIQDYDTADVVSYNDQGGPNTLEVGLRRLAQADHYVMHNGLGYDVPAIMKLYPQELWPDPARCIDTLVLSKLGNPERPGQRPHSLDTWGERVGIGKVEHTEWTRWSYAMEHRCNTDVVITRLVYDRLKGMYDAMPKAVEIEHKTAWETTLMIARGFGLDVERARSLTNELLTEKEELTDELRAIFPPILVPVKPSAPVRCLKTVNRRHPLHGQLEAGQEYCPVKVQEFNPGSRPQIARRLMQRHGWKPKSYTDGGSPEISEDVLQDLPFPECPTIIQYLQADKKLGQLDGPIKSDGTGGGWLQHVTRQDRVHASLNPLRAVTGRPACSAPNVQQADTDKRMRGCWVPSRGRVLVGADLEGIELRCLAHYLTPLDGGAYARMLLDGDKSQGTDVHSVVRDLLGFADRTEVKRAEYGWLYGAGDYKLGLICFQDAYKAGREIDFAHLGLAVSANGRKPSLTIVGRAMRQAMEEGITGLGELVNGIKLKAKTVGKLRGLDGRTLWIRSEHSALNFLLQSAGIIVMKEAINLMPPAFEAAGLEQGYVTFSKEEARWHLDPHVDVGIVMWVHDEVQIEARPEAAEQVGEIVQACMVQAGENLGFRLPTPGTYDIGASWAETH